MKREVSKQRKEMGKGMFARCINMPFLIKATDKGKGEGRDAREKSENKE